MSIREAANLLADVDDVLKKAGRNSTCLYPSCSGTPIGSHIIARKVLKLIADNNSSMVLTWNPNLSAWDMARSVDAGESLMQAYAEPISVGIRDKRNVASPLFCETHDGPVFAPLEHDEFSCTAEQVLLLAYRALCAKTFAVPPTEPLFAVSRKHGHIHSLSTPEKLSRVLRYQLAGCGEAKGRIGFWRRGISIIFLNRKGKMIFFRWLSSRLLCTFHPPGGGH